MAGDDPFADDDWFDDFDTDGDQWNEGAILCLTGDERKTTDMMYPLPPIQDEKPLCFGARKSDILYIAAIVVLIAATAMLGVGLVMLLQLQLCYRESEDSSSHGARTFGRRLAECFDPGTPQSVATFLMILFGFAIDVLGIVPFIVYTCKYKRRYARKWRLERLYNMYGSDPSCHQEQSPPTPPLDCSTPLDGVAGHVELETFYVETSRRHFEPVDNSDDGDVDFDM